MQVDVGDIAPFVDSFIPISCSLPQRSMCTAQVFLHQAIKALWFSSKNAKETRKSVHAALTASFIPALCMILH